MTLVQRLLILVGAVLAILVGVGVYGIALYHDAREASVNPHPVSCFGQLSLRHERKTPAVGSQA